MADFKSFPSTRAEALALEYVKQRIDPDTTPEQAAQLYMDAYKRISEELKRCRESQWMY